MERAMAGRATRVWTRIMERSKNDTLGGRGSEVV